MFEENYKQSGRNFLLLLPRQWFFVIYSFFLFSCHKRCLLSFTYFHSLQLRSESYFFPPFRDLAALFIPLSLYFIFFSAGFEPFLPLTKFTFDRHPSPFIVFLLTFYRCLTSPLSGQIFKEFSIQPFPLLYFCLFLNKVQYECWQITPPRYVTIQSKLLYC